MTDNITHTPTDDLTTVLDVVGDLVAAVRNDQWDSTTPCPEWSVRELVNHMVIGNRLFAGILRGEAAVAPGALDPKARDALGTDPVAAYRDAAKDLLAAFGQPGVLDRMFQVPVGLVPGIAALHLRAVEDLVHGWDLARATGQELEIDDEIVERELEFTRAKLADVPPDRSPFAPARRISDDATPLDRLAALLGRVAGPVH
ncbi:TIGR03086 family metal-binding protein [Amycolatopsis sp. 195334CR]|uniref:TIGR03086 family metal-binding protein n=1 Tax=Amycolatopsis sp. 195334CR TaxID=2814588 RepID=UPI001A8D12AE|nr:TIGR03086 family metal-binding protein [Amycolatopsis sp. 195334CR]MBN6038501.1 TIGR03086 family protein [Amycolatopsis sp. 195334CR]